MEFSYQPPPLVLNCRMISLLAAWMWIGMLGAFLFILIQLILIVDFAHAWNEAWVGNYEESQSKWWYCGRYLM